MTDQHPITPPPELVQQWWDGTHGAFYEFEAVTIQAARWGWEQRGAVNEAELQKARDEELEACCEWIGSLGIKKRGRSPPHRQTPEAAELEGAGAGRG